MLRVPARETLLRSAAISVAWRGIGSATTFLICYGVTQNLKKSGTVAVLELAGKAAIQTLYQRAWAHIPWGYKQKETCPERLLRGTGSMLRAPARETLLRSMAISVVWRAMGSATTFGICYAVTHDLKKSATIAVLELAGKAAMQTMYQRVWARVPWGYK